MMNSMLHMKTLDKYNCEKCRFSTKDPNKYQNHVSLHNDIKYACSHCTFVSYTKTEFQRHLVSHTGKFPYTCEYCGYGAIRNDYIVKHIKRIHGDGKIQCSVSTIENEAKNASVNITQAQVRSSLQEILQKSPFVTEEVIDLTTDADNLSSSNGVHLNGNNVSNVTFGQVEVKVISPVDQKLHPWMPLMVVAPQTFRVPANCIAQVVEVKSMNNKCHLVLKYVEPNCVVKKENVIEPKPLKAILPPEKSLENLDRSSLQERTESVDGCYDRTLHVKTAATLIGEQSNPYETSLLTNDNGTINGVKEVSDGIINDLDSVTEGPIISSVFSLSSDAQNIIEGIQWDCPSSIPESRPSNNTVDTTVSSNFSCESQYGVAEPTAKSSCQTVKLHKQSQKPMIKTEPDSPEAKTNVFTQNADSELHLPFSKPALMYDRKPDIQTFVSLPSYTKGRRKSRRLIKLETTNFSRPQTLFLTCDRRIVMQPVSCVMQNGNQTVNPVLAVHKITDQESAILKTFKKCNSKANNKTIPKRLPKTLRLFPFKSDQLRQVPSSNQPVVVLNHPDLESPEIAYIMKAIGDKAAGRMLGFEEQEATAKFIMEEELFNSC